MTMLLQQGVLMRAMRSHDWEFVVSLCDGDVHEGRARGLNPVANNDPEHVSHINKQLSGFIQGLAKSKLQVKTCLKHERGSKTWLELWKNLTAPKARPMGLDQHCQAVLLDSDFKQTCLDALRLELNRSIKRVKAFMAVTKIA